MFVGIATVKIADRFLDGFLAVAEPCRVVSAAAGQGAPTATHEGFACGNG
jgi:hypothetical protein